MTIELNHTIVHVRDRDAAAREVADTLGLGEPTAYGPFMEVKMANGVNLDFMEDTGEIDGQHYAFLVGDEDFDRIHQRLKDSCRQWWADPLPPEPGSDQHQRRWARALLGRAGRALARDHHGAVRRRLTLTTPGRAGPDRRSGGDRRSGPVRAR